MKAFHPLARLAVTAAVLVMLMFCRSVTAAAVGLVTGLCCIGLTDGRKSLLKWLGASLLTAFAMAVIDPLVSHRGMTVLLFVNGRAYTLESMLYGLELGLSLGGVTVWLTAGRRLISEREMLCMMGRLSPKLALTVSMTLGFIPRLAETQRRIRDAQRGAGLFADNSPTGRMGEAMAVFTACAARAAENAAGAARSMNARGFGRHRLTYSDRRKLRRADIILTASEVLLTAASLVFAALGGATEFYPALKFGRYEPALAVICGAAGLPAVISLAKEVIEWKLYLPKG